MILETINFRSLGTDIAIQAAVKEAEREEAQKSLKEIKEFYFSQEKIFSRFDGDSELSKLNKNLGVWQKATPSMLKVANLALEYYKLTEGLYDPRVIAVLESIGYKEDFSQVFSSANRNENICFNYRKSLVNDLKIGEGRIFLSVPLDFSGLVKGYATDRAADYLKQQGIKNFLVDSGGDIRVEGGDREGENWIISVESLSTEKILLELKEGTQGVATSGISRRKWRLGKQRFHHLVNPKNPGRFSFDLRSVTVIAENAQEADIWAKTLFLMGKETGLDFSEQNKLRSLFIDYRGNSFISNSLKDNLC